MFKVISLINSFDNIAFSGSRFGSVKCASLLSGLSNFNGTIRVGCAKGVDSLVQHSFENAIIFKAKSHSKKELVIRSTNLVKSNGIAGGLLIAFPCGAKPNKVSPSHTFYGGGSGTWGSIALAIGFGYPVIFFTATCPWQFCSNLSTGWFYFNSIQLALSV